MVENIISEMIELIEKKLISLKHILGLKPKQKEAIEEENMEGIESAIDGIQSQINIVNEIDSMYMLKLNELKSYTDIEDIAQLNDIKYPRAIILKDKLAEIKSLLQQIKVLDDDNNLLMSEKFAETKERLKNLRQGQKMAKGYFVEHSGTMFIDERN
ncbi:flagellar export chaperone FlgN [Proteiniborus sp. MB09-C3]|uniref:flagellar export chaperone FlgN n=1 Tax=Proteiniborus sp. MB09-C3 TaxID=3050072 RepID=UPI0025531C73|nr:flagellar export chaperone FlgN [Proteiniborus sp. MB09-C3]WIV12016.1 flagellar export chaperone FlgN [Proteiniborus sp. MB09-C3]